MTDDPKNENEEDNPIASAIMGYAHKRDDSFLDDMLNPPLGSEAILESMKGIFGGAGVLGGFNGAMACQELLRREEAVIRSEWLESLGEPSVEKSEDAIRRYVEARSKTEAKFGVETTKEMLREARKTHNECARWNLDSSKGHLYCWVLPEFYSDGSHEPFGPRDVPWATVKK